MKNMWRKLWERTENRFWKQTEREFLPSALELSETPPSPWRRGLLWASVLFLILVLVWSIAGSVDEVAVAPGKIIPAGQVKVVQAEDKGIVKAIHVKDGMRVTQGQVLVELDPTVSGADLARIRHDTAYYALQLERLRAEASGQPFVPPVSGELDQRDVDVQMQLYSSRVNNYQSKLAAGKAAVIQAEAGITSARANLQKSSSLYEIAAEKEQRIQKLVEENAVALFVLLDHRSKRIELENDMKIQEAEVRRQQAVLAQSEESLSALTLQWNSDVQSQFLETKKQWVEYAEELKKASEKERLSKVVSPVDGRVAQLSIHTVGGIVTAAQALMVIVPEETEMEVEAWVANKDVGFVYPGQKAEVKVETFSFQKYGTLPATISEVGADAVEDKDKGRVYRVVLALDQNQILVNGNPVFLSPGMSVTAEIKIREKQIIEFFLDPFRQYKNEALRER